MSYPTFDDDSNLHDVSFVGSQLDCALLDIRNARLSPHFDRDTPHTLAVRTKLAELESVIFDLCTAFGGPVE